MSTIVDRMTKSKAKVMHSESKDAWNVIGTVLGGRWKIARFPYLQIEGSQDYNEKEKIEQYSNAMLLADAINTTNDSKRLPSELLQSNQELLEALEECFGRLPINTKPQIDFLRKVEQIINTNK